MSVIAAARGRIGRLEIDVAFGGAPGRITALCGPSGAGKTSLLRWLAGLLPLDGRLIVDGEAWQDGRRVRPAHRRAVGMTFQGQGLLPHLSVRDNLAYARRRAGAPLAFADVVGWTGIETLLDRRPASLSGGEAQRAAIARALIGNPRLLLLDEPMSALDAAARTELGALLARLLPTLTMSVFLVSHDADEVSRLAHEVIRIENGHIALR